MTLKEGLLNKRVAIIFIIFLAALGVRLIALKQNYVIAQDGVFYIKMAKLISAADYDHEFLGQYQHYAFFPLLILLFHKVVADWILAGQLVGILCGAGAVIPLYFLAKRIFAEKVALLAAIFYIICPNLVRYSAEILRDIPSVFFYTMALWWGYKGIKDGRVVFMGLASLLIVLSTSLRVDGLTLLVSLLLFLVWYGSKNDIPWKKRLITFGVFWASALCIFVVLEFSLSQKGIKISTTQISRNMIAFTSLDNQTIRTLEKEVEEKGVSLQGRSFFNIARKHRFVLYSSHILYKTVKVFNILFLLFLLGLIKRREIGYRQDEFLLFTIYVTLVSVFLLYLNNYNYLSTRHPFSLVVPSLIWSGVGFVELKQRIVSWIKGRDFPLRELSLRWITPLLLIVICVPLLSMAWAPQRKDKLELKEIGLWLKHNGQAHSIIMGQLDFPRLAFYADGDFIQLPRGSYEDIVRFAREKKANLLVINGKTIDRFSPNFLNLVSDRDLQRIYIPGIKTPKYATLVFQVKDLKGKALNPR
jgi:hypothetical protein